ncbi:MAG: hypothetical protein NTV76_06610 [Pseudomonas sp.]|nr:hypothetical protein [Pseudomonas sp.]
MGKAKSWPMSQESTEISVVLHLQIVRCDILILDPAPLQGNPVGKAQVLPLSSWLKNDQAMQSVATYAT